jgi:hypothetical protein
MGAATPVARRSRRALAAKIAGIVGIVVCAAILAVVWIGRGALSKAFDDLAADVNGGFERAIAATDGVAERLDEAASRIEGVATEATELASSSSPSPQRLAGLQARLGEFADRYRELRVRYADVKENATSAVTALRNVGRIVPGTRVPEAPTGAIAAVDERLRAIDETLTSAWTSIQEAEPGSAAASALAERATALQAVVEGTAASVAGVSSSLTSAQADATRAIDGIRTILLIAALVISALFIWVLVLNLALWLLGRAWQREARATGQATGGDLAQVG